jgi:hypothetical protein
MAREGKLKGFTKFFELFLFTAGDGDERGGNRGEREDGGGGDVLSNRETK